MKHILTLLTTIWLLMSATAHATVHDDVEFSDAELDSILAPIALYPDTVLSHILIAATYPIEVVEAARWSQQQEGLSSEDILLAAELHKWDPSVQALTPFPELLKRMSEDLQWTQQVGDAFLQSEGRVLDSIQKLRQRAYEEGNLESNDYQEVEYSEGEIIIEPTRTKVVYVPYYDTRVVYGRWWWPSYPPCHWAYRPIHGHPSFRIGFAWWTPGFYLGTGVYFGGFHWHHRQVVVVHHSRPKHYSRHHVAHYQNTRRWVHNPHHRRGVHYRTPQVAQRYHSTRPAHPRLSVHNRNSVRTYSTPQRHQASREQHDRLVRNMRNPGSERSQSAASPRADRSTRTASPRETRSGSTPQRSPHSSPRNTSGASATNTPDRNDRSSAARHPTTAAQSHTRQTDSLRGHTRNSEPQRTPGDYKARSQAEEWRYSGNPKSPRTSGSSQTASRSQQSASAASSSRQSSASRSGGAARSRATSQRGASRSQHSSSARVSRGGSRSETHR